MTITIFAISALFLAVVVLKLSGKKKVSKTVETASEEVSSQNEGVLTFKKRLLLTETEAVFYRQILPLVPEGFFLSAKVGLWALVKNEQRAGWSKISQKQVDFAIFKNDFMPEPVAVIELDDASHSRSSAKRRDDMKDGILRMSGISIIRVPVQKEYDLVFLSEEIRKVLPN